MKLALGSAQFGLDYGISNTDGQVEISEVGRLVNPVLDENMVL